MRINTKNNKNKHSVNLLEAHLNVLRRLHFNEQKKEEQATIELPKESHEELVEETVENIIETAPKELKKIDWKLTIDDENKAIIEFKVK